MEIKTCRQCNINFTITDDDQKFYEKISPEFAGKKYSIPTPTLCPLCRRRRRFSWRNERSLYNRPSSLSGQNIVSIFPADSPYKVFSMKEWFSDAWDAKEFGQDYDFGRSFFDQFQELQKKVPRIALINLNNENSEYINCAGSNKDSYLSFDIGGCQSVLYSRTVYHSINAVDCLYCRDHCENIYQCTGCSNATNSRYCIDCADISDCYYCYDLKGCRNCLFSSNLRNKQYYINNQSYSKEDYEKKLSGFIFSSFQKSREYQEHFMQIFYQSIRPYADLVNCENCSGDYLLDCKNVHFSFDAANCTDCKFMIASPGGKDNYDDCFSGYQAAQLNYESVGSEDPYHCFFVYSCWSGCRDLIYGDFCQNCQDCFGCVGLKKAQYCILNKQYSKEQYEQLVPKIIEQMKQVGEWGEFFPTSISPFAYNETIANDYFPLKENETKQIGGRWREIQETLTSSNYPIPDDIKEVNESICQQVLECEVTKRPYKIQPQELIFYIKQGIPIPRRHPDQRFRDRLALTNPWQLFTRQCNCENSTHGHAGQCPAKFETTYAPERPEKVYCKECYQKPVI